jgi:aspartate/tyrosine/aromatic aminotransferase
MTELWHASTMTAADLIEKLSKVSPKARIFAYSGCHNCGGGDIEFDSWTCSEDGVDEVAITGSMVYDEEA